MTNRLLAAAAAFILLTAAAPEHAAAKSTVRILTLNDDSCRSYTMAMETGDKTTVLASSGWFIGFLAGVAQGTGVDFLRNVTVTDMARRLYDECLAHPQEPLSLAAEEIANSSIAAYQRR